MDKLIGVHPLPAALCPVGNSIYDVLDRSYQKVRDDLCHSLEHIMPDQVLSDYHQIQESRSMEQKGS